MYTTSWIFTWKDRCIDLPWLTSPWCPFSMILGLTTRVWMDQNIKFASVLSGPHWSRFDELLWDKECILSSKKWTSWHPIDSKRANLLLTRRRISNSNGTILFSNQVKLLHKSVLEIHSFSNVSNVSLPNSYMNMIWINLCILTGVL